MKKLALVVAFLAPLVVPGHGVTAAAPKGDPYGDGIKKVQQAVAEGDLKRAETVLDGLFRSYGENAELLAMRGRILFWEKRYGESLESLERAQTLRPTEEVAAEMRRVETARQLAEADRLVAQGEFLPAGALLSRVFESGADRYGAGTRLASVRNRQGRHREAAQLYQLLMRDYPKDAELPLLYAGALVNMGERERALGFLDQLGRGNNPAAYAMRGRIYFNQGRFLDAREEYEKAKRLGGTPDLAARRKEVEDALNLQHAQALVAAGGYELAQPLLQSMSASGPYTREARLLTGRSLLAQRRYGAALVESRALHDDYPQDPEVAALYAESLVGNRRGAEAEEVLLGVAGSAGERLRRDSEELFYRAKENWLQIFGEGYHYTAGYGSEHRAGVSVSRRFRGFTGVATASETTRFGLTDPQLALELYLPRWKDTNLSGALYLSTSPGSSFLARYTAGGEIGWALPSVELMAGYNRLGFHENPADVVSAAAVWYLPLAPVSLAEKVYFNPDSSSALWVTTVSWVPSYRLRTYLSGGVGTSSERRTARQDVERHDTWSIRAGGEYRFSPRYSMGGEGSFESRRGLYDRSGGALYLRYWWN